METACSGSMIVLFSSCALLLFVAWKVLNWAWLTPKKLEKRLKQQGFKGNPYRLIYGDFEEISTLYEEARSKPINLSDDYVPRVIPDFHKTVSKYGKNSYIWLGTKPTILIMDPEHIKRVTQKIHVFQKPAVHPITKFMIQGVLVYNGNKWTKQRKLLNPAFHMDKLKLMHPAFYKCAHEMLTKWEEKASPKGSIELDICPYFQTLTSDAISRTAFGSNYEKGRRIFELQREQRAHVGEAARSIYIPGLSWLLPTKSHRRMKQSAKEIGDAITGMINARLKAIREGEGNTENDLLGLLLESNSQEIDKHGNKESAMTINEVIEECKLFYIAGQETVSMLLVWTMILLCRYPDWQARVREEILQQFGTNTPDFDGLNHLKIITMILYEVLRLYPPFPVTERETAEETNLGNLTLPSGVQIILPIMLLHHDPEIWGTDVKEFKPERFAEGISNATKGQVGFLPFGWGPRICIGQNFALLEVKLALAMILQRFSFELSPSYTHAPCSVVIVQPQYGAHLILHKL